MRIEEFNALVEKLREKLLDKVPDQFTGSITLHMQTGALSGKVDVQLKV